ncbi:MAG: TonB-dependent receptor [Desulfobacterales bacterium]|nr:TonB-dependent receptor [Desulfobacterales bacterium]
MSSRHRFSEIRQWARRRIGIMRVILTLTIVISIPGTCFTDDNGLYDLSLDELLDVKVYIATKTDIRIDDAPSIVMVITSAEIERMGARDLIDVLRVVPGFDFVNPILIDGQLAAVRGLQSDASNNKIKVLINGQAAGEGPSHGGFHNFFTLLPLDIIDKIELIRGPGSALYGTNAFLSAINLITKTGGKAPSGLSAKAGSFNTRQYTGEYSNQWKDFNLYGYAGYFETDGESRTMESRKAAGPSRSTAGVAPAMITEARSHQEIFINTHYKNFYVNGILMRSEQDPPAGFVKTLVDEFDLKKRWSFTNLGWKAPVGPVHLAVNAFYDYSDLPDSNVESLPDEPGPFMGFPEGETPLESRERKNSTAGVNLTIDYPMDWGLEIVGGFSYEHRKSWDLENYANYNMASNPITMDGATYRPGQYIGDWVNLSDYGESQCERGDMSISAVYGQALFDLKKIFSLERGATSLFFTAGLRLDDYDAVGDFLTPRFGLSYSPDGKLFLKGLYGQAFRAPTFREMFTINDALVQGNPDLEPETNTTYEFQIGYNFTHMKMSLTYFHIDVENLISASGAVPGSASMQFENGKKMASRGIEAELKWLFDQDKYLYANMIWQNVSDVTRETIYSPGGAAYTQDDFFPGGAPEYMFNVGGNYRFFSWLNANAWVNFSGKRDRSEEMTWVGETLTRVDSRDPLEARALVNLALTFHYKDMEVQVCGYNLLDADLGDPDPGPVSGDDFSTSSAGFLVKMSYTF